MAATAKNARAASRPAKKDTAAAKSAKSAAKAPAKSPAKAAAKSPAKSSAKAATKSPAKPTAKKPAKPAAKSPAKPTAKKPASARPKSAVESPGKSAARPAAPAATQPAAKATKATRTTKATKTTKTTTKAAKATRPTKAAGASPAAPPFDPAEFTDIRKALEDRLVELREEQSHALADLSDLQRDRIGDAAGDDQADTGTKTFEREQELSLVQGIGERIGQVEHALARLDDGTYGRCERCGNPIPKARLEAFPSVTLCVTCKQREERR